MEETALVPVFAGTINHIAAQLCDARILHTRLNSGQEFANWIKGRIDQYGFIEGEDFLTKLSKTRGRPRTDYHLTLNMAKELAMIENNDIGREVRRYFIRLETSAAPSLITAAQAGELATLIAARFPEGKDRPYAWSRFNNHFRIARYRELPASRFAEACAYIGAMPVGAKALPHLPAGEALAAARKVALDYFDAIRAGEKNPRVNDIPEDVLTGIISSMLMNNRWLVSFDPFSGRMNTMRIDPAAFMVTTEQLPSLIREPLNIPAQTLFDIQTACCERIKSKFGAMEEARFIDRHQKRMPARSASLTTTASSAAAPAGTPRGCMQP